MPTRYEVPLRNGPAGEVPARCVSGRDKAAQQQQLDLLKHNDGAMPARLDVLDRQARAAAESGGRRNALIKCVASSPTTRRYTRSDIGRPEQFNEGAPSLRRTNRSTNLPVRFLNTSP
jgi:hypothetical protein